MLQSRSREQIDADKQLRRIRNQDIFIRYVSGETIVSIAERHSISKSTADAAFRQLVLKLWERIRNKKLMHPYTPTAYPQFYRGGLFRSRYLNKRDFMAHADFWIALVNDYAVRA